MSEKPRAADPGSTGSAPGGSATAGQSAGEQPRVVIRDNRKINTSEEPAATDAGADVPAEGLVADAEVVVDEIEVEAASVDGPPVVDAPAQPVESGTPATGVPPGAELEGLRAELDERTRDLQRVTAEYANYRKRWTGTAAWSRSRRPARCSPRCCRSWTTWTGPASTAIWWARSARWPSSSPPRWAGSA